MVDYTQDQFEQALQIVTNAHDSDVHTRGSVAREFGRQFYGERDIWDVLGYDHEVSAEQYRAKYERQDIAKRIVDLPARDTWRYPPEIVDDDSDETDFEADLQILDDEKRLYHYCERADVSAGVGEYGLMFLGFADNQPLDQPVNEGALNSTDDLAFVTPFAQDQVEDWTLGKEDGLEPTDARYNRPVTYYLDFGDVDDDDSYFETVHWTRVVHIVEGNVESDLKGTPRLRPVYNRLDDLEKVVGASAEMFWTGADRKFQFDIKTDDTQQIDPDALENLDDEVEKLVHDMQQYIKTFNTDVEVFGGDDPDPTGVIDELMKFISGATGCPKRILTGSERGELASSQDRANWYGRIESRQNNFAEPIILRPIVDRLIKYGIVREPRDGTYEIEWPNLFELTELEQADAMNARAQALARAAPQGNTDLLGSTEDIMAFVLDGDWDPEERTEEIPDDVPESELDEDVAEQLEAQFKY